MYQCHLLGKVVSQGFLDRMLGTALASPTTGHSALKRQKCLVRRLDILRAKMIKYTQLHKTILLIYKISQHTSKVEQHINSASRTHDDGDF